MDQDQQLPPELLQMLLASGGNVGNMQDRIKNQQEVAAAIRASAPEAGGRTVNNGRTFVAASPWETAAKAMSGVAGQYAQSKVPGMQEGMRGAQTDQFQQVLAALLRQRQMSGMGQMSNPPQQEPNTQGAMGY